MRSLRRGPARDLAPVLTLVVALVVTLGACSDSEEDDRTLTVLAAASLTGTFTALAEEFETQHPGVEVELAFDSSATLAAQALQGAPADVLATADLRTMQGAAAALATDPQVFATNTMVMVVPQANEAAITSFDDVAEGEASYVACVQSAPCGAIWAALAEAQEVRADPASLELDVKAVLAKVTSDEADAGFVYATDAVAAGAAVETFEVPGAEDQVTTYPLAVLDQATEPALAQDFVDLVRSEVGQRLLAEAGFGPP